MNHFHIGFFEWLVFVMYYVITKTVFLFVNIEARRNHWHVPAAVAGVIT